jgi:hypothetical protein
MTWRRAASLIVLAALAAGARAADVGSTYPTGSITTRAQADQALAAARAADREAESAYKGELQRCAKAFLQNQCTEDARRALDAQKRVIRRVEVEARDVRRRADAQERADKRSAAEAKRGADSAPGQPAANAPPSERPAEEPPKDGPAARQRDAGERAAKEATARERAARAAQEKAAREKGAAENRAQLKERQEAHRQEEAQRKLNEPQDAATRAENVKAFEEKQRDAAAYAKRKEEERIANEKRREERRIERERKQKELEEAAKR